MKTKKSRTILAAAMCAILALVSFAAIGCKKTKGGGQAPEATIAMSVSAATVMQFHTVTLTATTENTDEAVIWKTSDSSVATVAGGTVRGIKPGSATITASAGGASATCAVTVTESDVLPVVTGSWDQSGITLDKGGTFAVNLTIKCDGNDISDLAAIEWERTGADGIASIEPGSNSAMATITGREYGDTAFIAKATIDDKEYVSGELNVHVGKTGVVIDVTGDNVTEDVGSYSARVAMINANEGADVSQITLSVAVTEEGEPVESNQVEWTMLPEDSIISVDKSAGTVTAVSVGEAAITISYGGTSTVVNVTVYRPEVEITSASTIWFETAVANEIDFASVVSEKRVDGDSGNPEEATVNGGKCEVSYSDKLDITSEEAGKFTGCEGEDVTLAVSTDKVTYNIPVTVVTKAISTKDELKERMTYLRAIGGNATDFEGVLVLADDIDMEGETLNDASGYRSDKYVPTLAAGMFDGRGHIIFNAVADHNAGGLFAGLKGNATVIKDTVFVNAQIKGNAGLVVGRAFAGTIDNVIVYGKFISGGTQNNFPASLLVSDFGDPRTPVVQNCLIVSAGHDSAVNLAGMIVGGANQYHREDIENHFSHNITVNLAPGNGLDSRMPHAGEGLAVTDPGRKTEHTEALGTTLAFHGWNEYLAWAADNDEESYLGAGQQLLNGIPVAKAILAGGNALISEVNDFFGTAAITSSVTSVATGEGKYEVETTGLLTKLSLDEGATAKGYTLDNNVVVFPDTVAAGDRFTVTITDLVTGQALQQTLTVKLIESTDIAIADTFEVDVYHTKSENGGTGTVTLDVSAQKGQIGETAFDEVTIKTNKGGADEQVISGAAYNDGKITFGVDALGYAYGEGIPFEVSLVKKNGGDAIKSVTLSFKVDIVTMIIKTKEEFGGALEKNGRLDSDPAVLDGFMKVALEYGNALVTQKATNTDTEKKSIYFKGLFRLGNDIEYNAPFRMNNAATVAQGSSNGSTWHDDKEIQCGFSGIFDGRGYSVIGLEMCANNAGIFGMIAGHASSQGTGGIVKNVAFLNASYNVGDGGGIIAFRVDGTIENVYIQAATTRGDSNANSGIICREVGPHGILRHVFVEYTKADTYGTNGANSGKSAGTIVSEYGNGPVDGLYAVGATEDYALDTRKTKLTELRAEAKVYKTLAEMEAAGLETDWGDMWTVKNGVPVFKFADDNAVLGGVYKLAIGGDESVSIAGLADDKFTPEVTGGAYRKYELDTTDGFTVDEHGVVNVSAAKEAGKTFTLKVTDLATGLTEQKTYTLTA